MSMWGRAAAGAGKAASEIANKYIDNELATARAQAIADIQRASGMAQLQDADAFNNDPNRLARNRANKVQDITAEGTARGGVELNNAIAAATNEDLTKALAARAAREATAKDENTTRDVSPGQQQVRGGKMVYENTRPTAAEVSRDAYAAGQKGPAGAKSDRWDEKQWNDARKVDLSVVSFPDAMGGKGVESPELRQVFRTQLSALQARGDVDPQTASDLARETTLKLKNKASEMVDAARQADKKSTLTEQQAVQQILKQFADAQRAPAAAATNPSGAATKPPAAAPAPAAAAPVPLMKRAAATSAPDPTLAGKSLLDLQNTANSPRSSPEARVAAQAEIDRRAATQPQANTDPQYDPNLYGR